MTPFTVSTRAVDVLVSNLRVRLLRNAIDHTDKMCRSSLYSIARSESPTTSVNTSIIRVTKKSYFFRRLEQLTLAIEDEYTKFDEWRENCDNVNKFLLESERLINMDEKIGNDIDKVKEQLDDNGVSWSQISPIIRF